MLYDIIIIGGGMVGASLAAALQDTPFNIALIDATLPQNTDDPRLIALNYTSYTLYKNLGVWDALAPHAEAIHEVHISDRGQFGMTRLSAKDLGLTILGYVVPAKYINAALNQTLNQHPHLKIFRPSTLKKLSQTTDAVEITISNGATELQLTGKLIIGADGTYSTVRKLLNIATETFDYQQSALVTVTTLQRSHHHIAYERFHATGAIAMLPLTEQRCATIWTDKTSVIQELLPLSDDAFLAALQQQFGYRNGRLLTIAKRHSYPLVMIKAKPLHQQRILLLGNAAHTLHPIAAQGLNLALAEIAKLTECLTTSSLSPDWSPYLAWQKQQQTISSKLSHQLPWLFAQDFLPIKLARGLGMIGLDICPPAKRRFIKRVLGRAPVNQE